MKIFLIILIACAAALWGQLTSVYAQTGEDFFHQAAAFYINGNLPEARRAVETGIMRDPSNPKLKKLRSMLDEEEPQQQQQSKSEQQDQQDQNQQEQQQNEPQKEQQQTSQQKKDKEQLSKEDAARLLEALKNQEKETQKQRQMKVQGRARVDKDW